MCSRRLGEGMRELRVQCAPSTAPKMPREPRPISFGALVCNHFFLGKAGQGKRRNRDAPSPATKFHTRSHATVQVPSSASTCVQGGVGGSWEKWGRKPASAEVSRLSEHFTHLFTCDHGNMESLVINRVPNDQWLNQH